jgi:paired small multidrug resistance pump
MSKSWLYVVLAGIVEVLWVIGLKYSVSWFEWAATAVVTIHSDSSM